MSLIQLLFQADSVQQLPSLLSKHHFHSKITKSQKKQLQAIYSRIYKFLSSPLNSMGSQKSFELLTSLIQIGNRIERERGGQVKLIFQFLSAGSEELKGQLNLNKSLSDFVQNRLNQDDPQLFFLLVRHHVHLLKQAQLYQILKRKPFQTELILQLAKNTDHLNQNLVNSISIDPVQISSTLTKRGKFNQLVRIALKAKHLNLLKHLEEKLRFERTKQVQSIATSLLSSNQYIRQVSKNNNIQLLKIIIKLSQQHTGILQEVLTIKACMIEYSFKDFIWLQKIIENIALSKRTQLRDAIFSRPYLLSIALLEKSLDAEPESLKWVCESLVKHGQPYLDWYVKERGVNQYDLQSHKKFQHLLEGLIISKLRVRELLSLTKENQEFHVLLYLELFRKRLCEKLQLATEETDSLLRLRQFLGLDWCLLLRESSININKYDNICKLYQDFMLELIQKSCNYEFIIKALFLYFSKRKAACQVAGLLRMAASSGMLLNKSFQESILVCIQAKINPQTLKSYQQAYNHQLARRKDQLFRAELFVQSLKYIIKLRQWLSLGFDSDHFISKIKEHIFTFIDRPCIAGIIYQFECEFSQQSGKDIGVKINSLIKQLSACSSLFKFIELSSYTKYASNIQFQTCLLLSIKIRELLSSVSTSAVFRNRELIQFHLILSLTQLKLRDSQTRQILEELMRFNQEKSVLNSQGLSSLVLIFQYFLQKFHLFQGMPRTKPFLLNLARTKGQLRKAITLQFNLRLISLSKGSNFLTLLLLAEDQFTPVYSVARAFIQEVLDPQLKGIQSGYIKFIDRVNAMIVDQAQVDSSQSFKKGVKRCLGVSMLLCVSIEQNKSEVGWLKEICSKVLNQSQNSRKRAHEFRKLIQV